MTSPCTESNRSALVANMLEQIPRSDQNAVHLHRLRPSAVKGDLACASCALAQLTFVQVFGAVTVLPGDTEGEIMVKARAQAATYFLKSLAAYVRKELALVSNWERVGVGQDVSLARSFTSGAQLV